jgi:hypothetical protein
MRLLKLDSRGELSLTDNLVKDIPPYAILSHTWGAEGDEVTFNDLRNGSGKSKAGYNKVQFCGEQARKDGLQYFWVDTCCIDKSNIPELQRAITSMFRWYRDAEKCYVYLSDVAVCTDDNNQTERAWEPAFRESRWFTRGWTLQELIAPRSVEFFSRERELLGSKKTLEQQIHEITDLPIGALRGAPLSDFSIEEQLRWAEKRETKWEEDKAYCLLGIFNVSMSLRYGEGHRAFDRLKKKINAFSASKCLVHMNEVKCLSDPLCLGHEKGLNLFDAPDIGEGLFIGREQDLLSMEKVLQPQSNSLNRRVLILGGMGGIGKTQLAVKYANKHHDFYSSLFWLNATSEVTMKQSLRTMANRIFPPETVGKWEDDQVWIHVSNWFSEAENGRWLLIFDNHDEPDLYTITKYYPSATHGSIIITTRQPDRINGEMVRVSSMVKEEDSLRILATRSGRDNVESGEREMAPIRERPLTDRRSRRS